jgi:hypothetical protein
MKFTIESVATFLHSDADILVSIEVNSDPFYF